MNKITGVKTLKNLKNIEKEIESDIKTKKNAKNTELRNYAKELGLNNTETQIIIGRNLSLNDGKEMAKNILDKKKRLELTQLLDKMRIPVVNRKQFYNKITLNSKINNIEKDVKNYLKMKSRENVSNVTKILDNYNIENKDRTNILKAWNAYELDTINDLKRVASNRAKNKKDKESKNNKEDNDGTQSKQLAEEKKQRKKMMM